MQKASLTTVVLAVLVHAAPALADQNEIMVLSSASRSGSHFHMLNYNRALGADLDSGFALRLDATTAVDYSTGFRVGLSYRFPLSSSTKMTATAGYSQRHLLGPGDTEDGAFVAIAFDADFGETGNLTGLVEYDTTNEGALATTTYLHDFGSFEVGPTVSYFEQPNYWRRAAGLTAAYWITDATVIQVTGVWAEEYINANPAEDASFVEVQLRTSF